MKVKELIKQLEKIHPDCTLKVTVGFCCVKLIANQSTDTTLAIFDKKLCSEFYV